MAVENDVHAVGIVVPAAGETPRLLSGLSESLQKAGGEEIVIIAHGGFSPETQGEQPDSGVDYIVDADAMTADFALSLLNGLEKQQE
jgi:methylmalonyl-CoA mutase cobalamin-binding domain/chain